MASVESQDTTALSLPTEESNVSTPSFVTLNQATRDKPAVVETTEAAAPVSDGAGSSKLVVDTNLGKSRATDSTLKPRIKVPNSTTIQSNDSPGPEAISPVLRRISTARKWQDLQSVMDRQPRGFDAVAVAMTLSRLSELLPGGIAQLDDTPSQEAHSGAVPPAVAVHQLCTELMSLLQLQLPRLPGFALSAALGAAGKLGARPPRPTWVPGALAACQSKMTR